MEKIVFFFTGHDRTRGSGHRGISKTRRSSRVGSKGGRNFTGRVGSGQKIFKSHGSGWVGLPWADPTITRLELHLCFGGKTLGIFQGFSRVMTRGQRRISKTRRSSWVESEDGRNFTLSDRVGLPWADHIIHRLELHLRFGNKTLEKNQGFSRVMTRLVGRVTRRYLKTRSSSRVGSECGRNFTGRVGSPWADPTSEN